MFLAVYGEDTLRVREFSQDLLEKFVAKYDPSSLNAEVFDFTSVSREMLVSSLRAAPFLAEKRFLFLKHVAASLKKTDAIFWTDLFAVLDPSTSLCFVDFLDEKTWKSSFLGRWLSSRSSLEVKHFPLPSLSRKEALLWIRARGQKQGAFFSDSVATFFYERVGGESQELAMEIHKLAAYASGKPVTREMIELLVPVRVASDFFGFLDLLPSASPDRLLQALLREVQVGADAFGLFGGLLRQLRILASVSFLLDRGVTSSQNIAQVLSLHPFVAQKALQGARSFPSSALAEVLEKALLWDAWTKMGISPDVLVARLLEELLFARKTMLS